MQDHIRKMKEVFCALAAIDSPLTEDDKVVYLLASLPDSFSVLVTALEASLDVLRMVWLLNDYSTRKDVRSR